MKKDRLPYPDNYLDLLTYSLASDLETLAILEEWKKIFLPE